MDSVTKKTKGLTDKGEQQRTSGPLGGEVSNSVGAARGSTYIPKLQARDGPSGRPSMSQGSGAHTGSIKKWRGGNPGKGYQFRGRGSHRGGLTCREYPKGDPSGTPSGSGCQPSRIGEARKEQTGEAHPKGEPILSAHSTDHTRGRKRRSGCANRKRRELQRQLALAPDAVSSKRVREVSDDAVAQADGNKRAKTQGDSYREALTGVKMAVVADNFPDALLNAELVEPIRVAIWDQLEATPDPLPAISVGALLGGALHVTCEGERAAEWLRGLSGKTVGDVKLRVVSAKELPRPIKMAWKTRNTWCLDASRVLTMLQRLNPSLRTCEWKVLSTQVEETHTRRIVLVDSVSAAAIKAGGFCLHAGMDKSTFKILEDLNVQKVTVGASVEEEAHAVTAPQVGDGEEPVNPVVIEPGKALYTSSPCVSPKTDDIIGHIDCLDLSSPEAAGALMEEGSEGGGQQCLPP